MTPPGHTNSTLGDASISQPVSHTASLALPAKPPCAHAFARPSSQMLTCALSVSSWRVCEFGEWSSPTLYSLSANAASPTPVAALSSAAFRSAAFRASFAASAEAKSRAKAIDGVAASSAAVPRSGTTARRVSNTAGLAADAMHVTQPERWAGITWSEEKQGGAGRPRARRSRRLVRREEEAL